MKKKIILGFLAFMLLAGTGLFIYINKVFLPVKLKEIILTRAQEFLDRKVTFKAIDYHLFQGVVIDNFTIYDKDDPDLIFLQVQQARLNVLLTPVFQKKIIIPSLIITQPKVHLARKEPAVWNFSDLLAKRRPAGAKSPFTFLLGGITIEKGEIALTDKTGPAPTTEKFENIDLHAQLSAKIGIKFQLDTTMLPGTSLSVSGNYEIGSRSLTAHIKTKELDPFKYVKMFASPPNFVHRNGIIENADLKLKIQVASPPGIEARGTATVRNADVTVLTDKIIQGDLLTGTNIILTKKGYETHVTGDLDVKNGKITLANGKSFAGDATARNADLTGSSGKLDLKGKFQVQNAVFVLSDEKSIKGNLSARQLSFKRDGRIMSAHGDLLAQNAQWVLSPTQQYQGTFLAPQLAFQFNEGDIAVNGQLEVQNADLTVGPAKIKGNLTTQETVFTFSKEKHLHLAGSFLLKDSNITIGKDKTITGTIQAEQTELTLADGKLTASGHAKITQGYLGLPEDRGFTGDPVIDFNVTQLLDGQTPPLYSGTISVKNGTLKGLPKVGQAEQIQGKITFANNKIYTDSLQLRTMDSNISLAGSLMDFKNPSVDIAASSPNVSFTKIRPFITGLLEQHKVTPSGLADITLAYAGPLNDPKLAKISVAANLKEVSMTGEKIPGPITEITGKITYSPKGASWQNLTGTFQGTTYTLSGQIEDLKEPTIETSITSPTFNATAAVKSREGVYKILSLKGTYFDSSFNVKGNYTPGEGNPEADLSGHINLHLENLGTLIPATKKSLGASKPTGAVALEATFNGKLKNWRSSQITVSGESQAVTLYGFKLNDVSLEFTLGKSPTSRLDIAARFYNGPLQLTSFIDPRREDLPMTLAATLKDTDLEQMAKDIKAKGKTEELKGNLAIDVSLEGPLTETARWRGQGSAAITNGQIFKFNLLKGIWRTMLIPEFEDIMFTHARTNFEIRNKRLVTKDLVLSSSAVDLSAVGWIDFDQNVNMNVNPKFKELTILQSASLKKGPTALLAQAQDYINIKISGTLQKPSYNVNTQPVKVLEKTTGSIIEGVTGIFEDIIN